MKSKTWCDKTTNESIHANNKRRSKWENKRKLKAKSKNKSHHYWTQIHRIVTESGKGNRLSFIVYLFQYFGLRSCWSSAFEGFGRTNWPQYLFFFNLELIVSISFAELHKWKKDYSYLLLLNIQCKADYGFNFLFLQVFTHESSFSSKALFVYVLINSIRRGDRV